MSKANTAYTFALCEGRHPIPEAQKSIFPGTVNPLDLDGMYETAWNAIPEDCGVLTVYVTGLTVAMLTVVRVCHARGIMLTAMHYDRDSGTYYAQRVDAYIDRCPYCGTLMRSADQHCPTCGS